MSEHPDTKPQPQDRSSDTKQTTTTTYVTTVDPATNQTTTTTTTTTTTEPAAGSGPGISLGVDTKIVTSKRWIVRPVQCLLSFICWILVVCKPGHGSHSTLQAMTAFGILLWLWSGFLCIWLLFEASILRSASAAQVTMFRFVEIGFDGFLLLFGFITGLVGAVQCNKDNSLKPYCDYFGTPHAALVFLWLLLVLLGLSILLTFYQMNKDRVGAAQAKKEEKKVETATNNNNNAVEA